MSLAPYLKVVFLIFCATMLSPIYPQSSCENELSNLLHAVESLDPKQADRHLSAMVSDMDYGRYWLVAWPLFLAWPKISFMPQADQFKARFKKILQSIEDYMIYDLVMNRSDNARAYLNRVNFLRTLPPTATAAAILDQLAQDNLELFGVPVPTLLMESTSTASLWEIRENLFDPDDSDQNLMIRYYLRQLQLLIAKEFAYDSNSALIDLEDEIQSQIENDNIHSADLEEWEEAEILFKAIYAGNLNDVQLILTTSSRFTIDMPYHIGSSPSNDLHLWTALQFSIYTRRPEIAQLLSRHRQRPEIAY